jgi:hypothetical protein
MHLCGGNQCRTCWTPVMHTLQFNLQIWEECVCLQEVRWSAPLVGGQYGDAHKAGRLLLFVCTAHRRRAWESRPNIHQSSKGHRPWSTPGQRVQAPRVAQQSCGALWQTRGAHEMGSSCHHGQPVEDWSPGVHQRSKSKEIKR